MNPAYCVFIFYGLLLAALVWLVLWLAEQDAKVMEEEAKKCRSLQPPPRKP